MAQSELVTSSSAENTNRRTRRRLKVAILSYFLPRDGKKTGGIERVGFDLAQGLANRGHDVTVWTYSPKPPKATFEVRELPLSRLVSSPLGLRLTMGYLGNILLFCTRYGENDVVVALGDSLLLPLRFPGRVVRVMLGSAWSEAAAARTPWRFLGQLGVYLQELLTGLTNPNTVGISHNTCGPNPFVRRVIPIGVDTQTFVPKSDAKTPHPSILFVGAMDGRKRGNLLLRWFLEDIQPRYPATTLHLVSRRGEPHPGVQYHTGISQQKLVSLYQQAWIYASPSTYEGFGLPYVEAMACGTPVVASTNPGSLEVLDGGRCGCLSPDEQFAAACCDLLHDAEKRDRLVASGLAQAERYSTARMLDQYEELLAEVSGGNA